MTDLKEIISSLSDFIDFFSGFDIDKSIIEKAKRELKVGKELIEKEKNKNFYVSVIATMKSGKSTFINALLGKDILPNETSACTLVSTEITLEPFVSVIKKVFKNGNIDKIKGSFNLSELFHEDVRNYRKLLSEGKSIDIERYEISHDLHSISFPDSNIKIIDTPGPNEMQELGINAINIKDIYKKILEKSSYIIFLLDTQYYKEEANKKLVDDILSIRPDLKEKIIFVLNKIDLFNDSKGVSIENAKEDIKNLLREWTFKGNYFFTLSAKKALYGRMVLNSSDLTKYENDMKKMLPLMTKIINGEEINYYPKIKEHYLTWLKESNIENLESFMEDKIFSDIKNISTGSFEDYISNNKKFINNFVNEWLNDLNLTIKTVSKNIETAKEQHSEIKTGIQATQTMYEYAKKFEKKLLQRKNTFNKTQLENELKLLKYPFPYRDFVDNITHEMNYDMFKFFCEYKLIKDYAQSYEDGHKYDDYEDEDEIIEKIKRIEKRYHDYYKDLKSIVKNFHTKKINDLDFEIYNKEAIPLFEIGIKGFKLNITNKTFEYIDNNSIPDYENFPQFFYEGKRDKYGDAQCKIKSGCRKKIGLAYGNAFEYFEKISKSAIDNLIDKENYYFSTLLKIVQQIIEMMEEYNKNNEEAIDISKNGNKTINDLENKLKLLKGYIKEAEEIKVL